MANNFKRLSFYTIRETYINSQVVDEHSATKSSSGKHEDEPWPVLGYVAIDNPGFVGMNVGPTIFAVVLVHIFVVVLVRIFVVVLIHIFVVVIV